MTGVEFLSSPVRVFDFGELTAGLHPVSLPTPPPGATQALVQVALVRRSLGAAGSTGVLMMHDCSVAPDSHTDIALPIDVGAGSATNQVYVPISGGLCMTTTATALRVIIEVAGWVVPDPAGAAYVDVPFRFVTTVVGPVSGKPIDMATLGVPTDAAGVAVWLETSSPTAGYVALYPCGQPQPLITHASWLPGDPKTTMVAGVPISSSGLCIFIYDGASVDISIDGYYRVGATPTATSPPQVRYSQEAAPGFVGTSPTRLFDTRTAGIPIFAGQSYQLDISANVPIDATAVVMNVTATSPAGSGFVTAYPCDGDQPDTSSLNFVANQTVPNLVTVDAGFVQKICFFASASTHLLADLAGYYVAGGGDGFHPSPPLRMFDTRRTAMISRNSVFEFDVSPFVSPDASSVVFNLTATDVDGPGYITAYPCGQSPPNASNLNVSKGQTVPNLVTVALPSNKHVCFFTLPGTNLLADLAGWYAPSATSGFISIQPTRWADTRDLSDTSLDAGSVYAVSFGPDFPDANAMVFNATATETQAAGYLTAYPCADNPPDASNVNFVAGLSVPNMVVSAVDADGDLCIFNSASSHWIVDVSGYFTDTPQFFSFFPDGTDIL